MAQQGQIRRHVATGNHVARHRTQMVHVQTCLPLPIQIASEAMYLVQTRGATPTTIAGN